MRRCSTLMAYEKDPKLLARYRHWMDDLWEMNWMEGNSLFTYMTLAFEKTPSHGEEALDLANDTLRRYPVDRVLRPVMNSIRADMEANPYPDRGGQKQAAKPIPIDERPLDNEYAWKGNPYQMDGWLLPAITALEFSCDDPQVAWFSDATGRIYLTRDGMKSWQDVSWGLEGARVRNMRVSDRRTYVVWADTDRGVMLTRDGGMSWRAAAQAESIEFPARDFSDWREHAAAAFRMRKRAICCDAQARASGTGDVRLANSTSDFGFRHGSGRHCRRAWRGLRERRRQQMERAHLLAQRGNRGGRFSACVLDGEVLPVRGPVNSAHQRDGRLGTKYSHGSPRAIRSRTSVAETSS